MVRLVGIFLGADVPAYGFQFQYGAIGSAPNRTGILKPIVFQFQYGAIGSLSSWG